MNMQERLCLARVRTMAIAEMVAAGGRARPAQLRRAIAPIEPSTELHLVEARGAHVVASPPGRRRGATSFGL